MKTLKEHGGTITEYCQEYNITSLKELMKLQEGLHPNNKPFVEGSDNLKPRPSKKGYSIIKKGKARNKQNYAITTHKKIIKQSNNLEKLFCYLCDEMRDDVL